MGRYYGSSFVLGHEEMRAVPLGDQADFIEKMIDVLETGGWTQGDHENDKGMCIEGAALRVLDDAKVLKLNEAAWDNDDSIKPPAMCLAGFAATDTLRDILGAELGMKPILVERAKNSAMYSEITRITVPGWDHNFHNPIVKFNDADGQTQERIIEKLRSVVEEIRAGQGVFDGDAPVEEVGVPTPTPQLSTTPTLV